MSASESKSSGLGTLIFTLLALVFTGVTAWLLAMMLSGTEYSKEPVRAVVATTRAIAPLQAIALEDLKVIKIPESAVPEGAFTKPEDLVGDPPRRPLVQLEAGEIVLGGRLADPEAGQGRASLIPKGMRAMVVRMDVATARAQLFYPGATVDLVATLRVERRNTVVTRIIMQGVSVLAIGTQLDPAHMPKEAKKSEYTSQQDEQGAVVTVLVTPEQSEQLTLAANEGRIDFVLRSPVDTDPTETPGARPEDLFPEVFGEEEETEDEEPNRGRRAAARRIIRRLQRKPAAPVEPREPAVQVY